jgi:hypothetical protein
MIRFRKNSKSTERASFAEWLGRVALEGSDPKAEARKTGARI